MKKILKWFSDTLSYAEKREREEFAKLIANCPDIEVVIRETFWGTYKTIKFKKNK